MVPVLEESRRREVCRGSEDFTCWRRRRHPWYRRAGLFRREAETCTHRAIL